MERVLGDVDEETIDLRATREVVLGPGTFRNCTILTPHKAYGLGFHNATFDRCEFRAVAPATVELRLIEVRLRNCSLVGRFEDAMFGSLDLRPQWPRGDVKALDVVGAQLHQCRFYDVPATEVEGFRSEFVGVTNPQEAASMLRGDTPRWLAFDVDRVLDDDPSLSLYTLDLVALGASDCGSLREKLAGFLLGSDHDD